MSTLTSPFDQDTLDAMLTATPQAAHYTLAEALLIMAAFVKRRDDEFKPSHYGGSGMRVKSISLVGGEIRGSSEFDQDSPVKIRIEGDNGYDTPSFWREGFIDPADGKFSATDGFN